MLRLSRKILHAVEAVVDIAYHSRPDPVQSKDVARRQQIPHRYLEPVMQRLVHAGVLRGVRGPKGGYRLARERRRITVGDIVRIVGALEAEEESVGDGGSALGLGIVRPLWAELERDVMTRLDAVTLEELCRQAVTADIAPEPGQHGDFTI